MPSIFRSEKVEFCQLVIPSESAYSVIQTIGQLECVEFINRNFDVSPFNLKFTQNVVWCEEMERRLGNLHNVLQSDKLEADEVPHNYGTLLPQNFGNFESEINSISTDIESNNKNLKDLRDGYNELTFYRQVVRCADELDDNFNQNATESSNNISGVYGVVSRFQVNVFEKFLYRACRGNVLFRRLDPEHEFTDIVTAETSIHCIFVIYLQGDLLMNKVKKISQVFGVPTFSVPDTHHERETLLLTLMTRVKDMELILHQTLAQRKTFINRLVRNLNIWKVQIRRAKAIFVTLNMFHYDTGSHTLIAECWCPHADIEKVQNALVIPESNDLAAILNTMQTPRTPPTFFRTNKFTRGFQNLVDAYGVANYKEINPSLFMVITFPFLFSVMFGDFGHAAVIFIFAVYLVVQEKALEKYKHMEMFDMLYAGRYIIFMMGLFSLYAGFIYNDIISKSVYIFPSSWKLPDHRNISGPGSVYLDPVQITQPDPYPIGLDPVWMFASNKITFVNSLKMKLSVIIGFIHMTFGILCGAANNLYFGKYLDFFAEFVPQILFFVSLFGYLVFLIFYKWIFVSSHRICGVRSS
ncbi:V-type proton ATPase subunit a isoform 1 [Thelohanellus kitauei]|uniref:V-type proton ATPase subunit a n=1 Tax=Thelohanellus kitauei TaxID=669202 RepID=A0A0C2JFI5_THEKT|nr:V-type proton ATPase subunit a isoform 1 [Thelohanellus kitauei]